MKIYAVGLCGILTALPASAQEIAPASQAVLIAPVAENVMRAGTEVPLQMREELTTKKKKLRVGQRFQMEVASSVTMNGVTVIPGGTPVVGEVTEVRNKGMWGKSGYIGARVVSMRLGDRHVRLTGTFDDKGVTGTAGVIGAVALVPLAGFFTTGTSAYIPMGSSVKAFLDEDLAFTTPHAQPATAPLVQSKMESAPKDAASERDFTAPAVVRN
ncbi:MULTISPECIES: hypothetical protein [unclassified Sphingobium]|uniref:hypothetical protein n=1 Tax=unclassified Sphingobium TaxID=2611147 RepID=UPI00222535F4|nr:MULTISPECIES: hypothetical protein [unclassified Sphingobium]MCW2396183.1 hypothetical protein [Sphingobium sp. B8D3B]MCW2419699.1 hypothetical protein [Sphingobium sp. B8D3C]